MNDQKGLLLFARAILQGQLSQKNNPIYVKDNTEWLSERYGCNTLTDLEKSLHEQLKILDNEG